MQDKEEMLELDVKGLLMLLLRKSWIIVLVALLVATLAFSYAKFFITPKYSASVRLYVNNIYKDEQQNEVEAGQLTAANYLAESYVIILYGKPVINEILDTAGLRGKYTVDELKAMVTTKIINQTEIFEITVTGEDSAEVTKIANVFAQVLPEKLQEVVEGSDVRMVDYAVESKQIVYPKYKNIMLIGFMLGFLLCALAVLTKELVDDGIHSEEYLTAIYEEIPLLAVIPDAKEPKNGNYRGYKNYYKKYYKSYYNSAKKVNQDGGNTQ